MTSGPRQGTTQVLAAAQLTALAPVLNPGDQLRYRHLTPELSNALLGHAGDFLATQGVTDEPVTWHPPTA